MIKKLFLVLLLFNFSLTYAQTIKTDILVIGGGPSGTAAAIQGARSKLKTLLVEPGSQLCPGMTSQAMITVTPGKELSSGTWGEFRRRVREFYKSTADYDTTYNAPLKFEPYTGAAIIKKIADTVKNLTLKLNAPVSNIKKDDDGWTATITKDGKNQLVKAKVLIDATPNAVATEKFSKDFKPFNFLADNHQSEAYRTSIATGVGFQGQLSDTISPKNNYPQWPSYCIPLNAVVAKGTTNLLITAKLLPEDDIQYLANQLTLGQGVGATAAFVAFFKTNTTKLNVRLIQGELLDFKGYLMPFTDVKSNDRYFRAIQQVGATGLLKGVQDAASKQVFFMPDSTVNTAEIEPVLNDIYTRTFLWFNREKPAAKFTIGNTLSLISEITLAEPKSLQIDMAKAWKTQYKFTSDFDLKRAITRREFAILINKFLNPFSRTVDLGGRLIN
ncbi:FAD-dependent oxidoreductase [Mucilaginibacter flavus]|uniref:FAD-dependent oxidoreductase n=1 Tax=Mucilaginibacter flavus TaxID=931504 RepID=UPI0025B5BDEE|nr:FAD-dependent oxidoreductase [Mucilaginibacter flavus]MDN3581871.1 FAD-dependent oxidoreductase [Mucilaginibacter flavus]